MKNFISKVPVPTAGLALGLVSLGVLLQGYSEVFHAIAGVLSLLLVSLLITKIVVCPHQFKKDLDNPITAGVLATLFMTIMQLATYLAPFSFYGALGVWSVALLAQVAYMLWFTVKFTLKFDLKQVFPTHFIAYAGIVVASLTSPVFGMEALGTLIFWCGFAVYFVLLAVVSYRYTKHDVPESAQPLFCIYAAPMSLLLAGYLSVVQEPSFAMVATMCIAAQLLLVAVLTQLPKILKLSFYPSYAAMTFPFVVSATALSKAVPYFATMGISETALTVLSGLVVVQAVLATGMVLYVFTRYMRFFFLEIRASKKTVLQPVKASR